MPFKPSGYCPRCDYQTGVGICPECGDDIPPHRLRRRPHSSIARHIRRLMLVAASTSALLWAASRQTTLVRYFPTVYLLTLQTGEGSLCLAARAELANRLTGRRLTAKQTEQFIKQWASIRWFATEFSSADDGLARRTDEPWIGVVGNRFFDRGFPAAALPPFAFEERVHRLVVNGQTAALTGGENQSWFAIDSSGWTAISQPMAQAFLGGPTHGSLSSSGGFYAATYFLTSNRGSRPMDILVETTVIVTELGTNKVLATWANAHSGIFASRESPQWSGTIVTQPPNVVPPFEPGMEDLMYPYGRIPGEFSPAEIVEDVEPCPPSGGPN